jgi:uncharacterized protein YfkK (UPF0435 family)
MSQIERLEVPPDAKRMIEGLRDTGYELNTAIADLVDNSIAASATLVDIRLVMDFRGKLRLSIADNGSGMDRDGLINAMKYGSAERPHPSSLGKFGLGLKTASTAFCQTLLVTTKQKGGTECIRAFWDLDHVAQARKWELQIDKSDKETIDHFNQIANAGEGTVVVWQKIDRVLKNYAEPNGKAARKALAKVVEELKEHLSMIYQRFLDQANFSTQNITIQVNGETLFPWDPFCITESDLVASQNVEVDGTQASFDIKAYVLPRREEFSSPEVAAIAKVRNEYQGFYIYRENRLIHYADWLGMFAKEPHGTLLRVEFSFDHRLDDAFQIDIKKSQIKLNSALYDFILGEFIPAPRRAADERYRQGQKKKAEQKANTAHAGSNNAIGAKQDEIGGAKVTPSGGNNDEAVVTNSNGSFKFKLKITTSRKPGEVFIQPVDSIDDNVLFEPALIDGEKGVRVNTSHPYYHKVYVPNLKSGVTVQGMDSLLWAICNAELSTINASTLTHFEELRFELSRILRRLVADLPDPDLDINETE